MLIQMGFVCWNKPITGPGHNAVYFSWSFEFTGSYHYLFYKSNVRQ